MRLFIAVPLSFDDQNMMYYYGLNLKETFGDYRYTRRENYHITMKFLGEVPQNKLAQIKAAMDEALLASPRIPIESGKLGTFPIGILWMEIVKSPELVKAYEGLGKSLAQIGFPVEKRAFFPHLTIAREIPPVVEVSKLLKPPRIKFLSTQMGLYESVRESGRLVYRNVYTVNYKI